MKKTVLVVDDSALFLKQICQAINKTDNFTVVATAENGDEAIKLAKEKSPDIITMDVNMPGVDGITATGVIRASHPSARIVVITQHDDPSLRSAALGAGAVHFLTKDDLTGLSRLLSAQ